MPVPGFPNLCALNGFTIQYGLNDIGGGILGMRSRATICNNVIANNTARCGGGLALCDGLVRHNDIQKNTSIGFSGDIDGGGLWNCRYVSQNAIHENVSITKGAGRYFDGIFGDAYIANNLIYENLLAPSDNVEGSGIHIEYTGTDIGYPSPAIFIANNTIVDNAGSLADANIIVRDIQNVALTNCIIWGSAEEYDRVKDIATSCNIEGAPEKASVSAAPWNFGDDPQFAPLSDPPYQLTVSVDDQSPAINAGRRTTPEILSDYLDFLRVDAPDIGALEYPYPEDVRKSYLYITGSQSATEGTEVTLTVVLGDTLANQNDNNSLHLEWFHNGVKIIDNCPCSVDAKNICKCPYTPTTLNLTMNPVLMDNAGEYVLRASFAGTYGGTFYSPPFILSVTEAPEIEGEGEALPTEPIIEILPENVWLGYVPFGGFSETVIAVVNAGGGTLTGEATRASEQQQIHFPWINNAHYSIPPGGVHYVRITCKPAQPGNITGYIDFSGGGGAQCTITASTTNDDMPGSLIQVTPSILQFGHVDPESFKNLDITITNIGTDTLVGCASVPAPFIFPTSNTYSLPAGDSTTLTVCFFPDYAQDYSKEIVFTGGSGTKIRVTGSAKTATSPNIGVRINEVLPWNIENITNSSGQHYDWIELFNENSTPVNLGGWVLTNDPANLTSYPTIPDGTILPANGYLIVYAALPETNDMGEVYTGFELDELNGGYVGLHNSQGGAPVSTMEYPSFSDRADWSYSYFPLTGDNTGPLPTNPSPAYANDDSYTWSLRVAKASDLTDIEDFEDPPAAPITLDYTHVNTWMTDSSNALKSNDFLSTGFPDCECKVNIVMKYIPTQPLLGTCQNIPKLIVSRNMYDNISLHVGMNDVLIIWGFQIRDDPKLFELQFNLGQTFRVDDPEDPNSNKYWKRFIVLCTNSLGYDGKPGFRSTVLAHELGHYSGIFGHFNDNDPGHDTCVRQRIMSKYFCKTARNIVPEECEYYRGKWKFPDKTPESGYRPTPIP